MLNYYRHFIASSKLKQFDCKFSYGVDALKRDQQVLMESHAKISRGQLLSKSLQIGAHSYIRSGYTLEGNIEIGRFCSIGNNVVIGLEKHAHPIDWLTTSMFTETFGTMHKVSTQPQATATLIGHDCWIDRDAVLMSGIKVGNGAIIGARAVVTKDVPDYAVVAGVPAKIIRYRFPESKICRLNQLQWWLLSTDDVSQAPIDNIDDAIALLKGKTKLANYASLRLTKNKAENIP